MRFRFYFTPSRGSFTFPHSTGSLSVDHEYLALEDGPPSSDRMSRVPPTYRFLSTTRSISHTGLSPSIAGLSRPFCCRSCYQNSGCCNFARRYFAISVDFFSWSYLDVSVRSVRLTHLCIQCVIPTYVGGFPHSEICGSMPVCRLPAAYRKLLRPSSPVIAKASTTYT